MKTIANMTIEQLEKDYWSVPENSSYLVTLCHKLRRKLICDFDNEDLRVMIGQNIGLKYLIPIAIEKLKQNILTEGDYYEGDLLTSVLSSDEIYWKQNRVEWKIICELFENNKRILEKFDTTVEIITEWFDLFNKFERYDKKES